MQFGHFDDINKEYVITSPNTPKSWSNYLGNTEYGAIITNNAGGYSFYKSGGMGRFMRMRFNSVPMDQSGRYIYLKDRDKNDFWSGSWQPVGKPLDQYKSTCHHGTGYTKIVSEYDHIESETTYYVPPGQTYEVWKVKISNKDKVKRNLTAFTYIEYAGSWNAIDDLMNIQYVQYTAAMKIVDGIIDHGTNIYIPEMPENFKEKDQGRHTFQALAGLAVTGYDTDREAFHGSYRTYANPIAVESGSCSNSLGYGDNPCGSLSGDISLDPGESKTFLVLVGIGKASAEGKQTQQKYSDLSIVDDELNEVKAYWHKKMEGFSAITPDAELNSTINTWGIYNSLITFNWSRAASLIYSGIDRDGLGYRDTVQDFMGVVHTIPEEVREKLELMISGQTSTGGAMPVILPLSHKPGSEPLPKESEYRSDDCLWLFNSIPAYVKETGNIGFYNKTIPYSDRGSASVFVHMKRAIEFNLERSGKHGLPCGLHADWNDCLRFGNDGESGFVTMQLRLALAVYSEVAELLNENIEKKWADERLSILDKNIQDYAWDGEWFLRGYRVDGMKFGSKESEEGQLFFNAQTWAVLSGAAKDGQGRMAMDHVKKSLATKYGIKVCHPPYTKSDYNIVRAQLMNPGLKENGGIFVHTQGWGVMAEAELGNGERAYEYLRAYMPAAYNNKAEIREIEPYVVCQSTHANDSPKFGASRVPWLSGSATWTYYAITQSILGVKPEYHGIKFDPCIPKDWDNISIQRKFRGKELSIKILNPEKTEKGVCCLTLNGEEIKGNYIEAEKLLQTNEIIVKMGKACC
ncbi:MAG: GH36-type glycosyl hydrolase domain-containing protein [Prolixibacteraceae bacterium]